ncbi:MAG: hypothetical protein ACTIJ6_05495 [Leucobacter sp.]
MEKFTASNGDSVELTGPEKITVGPGEHIRGSASLRGPVGAVTALREFFQHERDQELGRWRWPDNPQYVVYEDKARSYINQPAVIVINESDGATAMCGRDGLYSASGIGVSDKWCEPAAAAYFDALPVRKPWHDAKPGEVWALTYEGVEQAWGVGFDGSLELRFIFACGDSRVSADDADITAGRRIWPEVE